ncbi:unnamed protein product [Protopolystoma xenopodis]|uniref:Uncharacterized protein n=1 Tax=Protopolystoma xenopodis TaxID=117903 RepID=A0A448WXA9_9PLAT|nr:unnamed protein product [Protopolystoma xenopodis]
MTVTGPSDSDAPSSLSIFIDDFSALYSLDLTSQHMARCYRLVHR